MSAGSPFIEPELPAGSHPFSGQDYKTPDDPGVDQGQKDRGRTEILGSPGQFMIFGADPVNRCLHGAVQEFDNEDKQQAPQQHGFFNSRLAKKKGRGDQKDTEQKFLTKGGLMHKGGLQARHRPRECPLQPAKSFTASFCHEILMYQMVLTA